MGLRNLATFRKIKTMANYPAAISTFRAKENIPGETYDPDKKTTVYAEDFENVENEIIAIEEALGTFLEKMWPIGSIYTSTNSTNPGTSMGFGTWTGFGAGRVAVGFSSGETEFDTDEETGGAKTHTLTTAEMPSHRHIVRGDTRADSVGITFSGNGGTSTNMTPASNGANSSTYTGKLYGWYEGGDTAHNNLQPYIVVRMWKRIG